MNSNKQPKLIAASWCNYVKNSLSNRWMETHLISFLLKNSQTGLSPFTTDNLIKWNLLWDLCHLTFSLSLSLSLTHIYRQIFLRYRELPSQNTLKVQIKLWIKPFTKSARPNVCKRWTAPWTDLNKQTKEFNQRILRLWVIHSKKLLIC